MCAENCQLNNQGRASVTDVYKSWAAIVDETNQTGQAVVDSLEISDQIQDERVFLEAEQEQNNLHVLKDLKKVQTVLDYMLNAKGLEEAEKAYKELSDSESELFNFILSVKSYTSSPEDLVALETLNSFVDELINKKQLLPKHIYFKIRPSAEKYSDWQNIADSETGLATGSCEAHFMIFVDAGGQHQLGFFAGGTEIAIRDIEEIREDVICDLPKEDLSNEAAAEANEEEEKLLSLPERLEKAKLICEKIILQGYLEHARIHASRAKESEILKVLNSMRQGLFDKIEKLKSEVNLKPEGHLKILLVLKDGDEVTLFAKDGGQFKQSNAEFYLSDVYDARGIKYEFGVGIIEKIEVVSE